MIGIETGARRGEEAVRVVRALGAHRYVAGRMHLLHAAAVAALEGDDAPEALAEAIAWARATLAIADLDAASRDERLWRRAAEVEIAATLEVYWTPGGRSARARDRLRAWLTCVELPLPSHAPFDEGAEDDVHPVLVDAGWELVPLAALDAERHKGAIAAFGEPIAFEVARFEEENAIPPHVHLQELSAIGPVELVAGADEDGTLAAPFTLWIDGNETYHDYVIRGVRRAAKIPATMDA
jgi:hypothetical protein